jgi:hypothetical protein
MQGPGRIEQHFDSNILHFWLNRYKDAILEKIYQKIDPETIVPVFLFDLQKKKSENMLLLGLDRVFKFSITMFLLKFNI